MMLKPSAIRGVVLATAIAGSTVAAGQGGQDAQDAAKLRMTPSEVRWPSGGSSLVGTSGASGIQTVMLKGNPSKAGLYTMLLRVGPNTKIQAHSHPDDRVATVISGEWYFGYGKQFDESALKRLPPGSIYTEPPGIDHFAMTKSDVVIQITGTGPSGTTYVDPANDPARR
jgi:uncharacterized RmlC-like cupin family protein